MNRTTVAALITTAVIGVSAGTVTALVRGEEPAKTGPGSTPTRSTTPTPSSMPTTPAAEEPTAARVLWAEPGKVHDGTKEIRFSGMPKNVPDRLVRAKGGYVLAFDTSPQEPSRSLWFLSEDGSSTHLADVNDAWDLNRDGDAVTYSRLDDGELVVVGTDGSQHGTWAGPTGRLSLVWKGSDVIVTALDIEKPAWAVTVWTPATGAHRETNHAGMEYSTGNKEAFDLYGYVNAEGVGAVDDNYCLQKDRVPGKTGQTWFTCDWRPNWPGHNYVSPGGESLLVVSSETDGFGPGAFGIIKTGAGPSAGVKTIDVPDWALNATWVNDEVIAVAGSNGDQVGKSGGWIQQCDVKGTCTQVAKTTAGRVVVGEPF